MKTYLSIKTLNCKFESITFFSYLISQKSKHKSLGVAKIRKSFIKYLFQISCKYF